MHLSGYEFNREKLFLRFNGLNHKFMKKNFTKSNEDKEYLEKKYKLFELYQDEFLFRSYYAYSILKRMRLLKETALKAQFEGLRSQFKITDEKEILYSSFMTREYIYFVMPFLNTIFILQDRIMTLLSEFLNIQDKYDKLPKYYYDYKKKINKIFPLFPKPIQTLLINYWEKHGNFIRQYRNLDQHQYQLYYHSFYRLKPKEEYVLYLPDKITRNMGLHEITYKKKIIALDFFEKEFRAFHDFVENMLKQIKVQPYEIKPGSSFSPLERLVNYKNGDILSTMIIGNEALIFRMSNENKPDSEAKSLTIQKVRNNITSFKWEFK
ncbi:hypothetical protein LCGC14_0668150 [marine sediment metagenome]|uniref:Uncharacterized protein n=1 Tax=marine sediment metagenome TaxID=412755 RepID=A0A0F9QRP3_9ZZZZ